MGKIEKVFQKVLNKEILSESDREIIKRYMENLPVVKITFKQHDEFLIESNKPILVQPMDNITCYCAGINTIVLDYNSALAGN